MFEHKNELYLDRIAIFVSRVCNFKCKHCVVFAPYYHTPYHPEYQTIIEQIDAIFSIVSGFNLFELCGGEPLLRKELPDLIRYVYKYTSQIKNRFRIVTNGSIIPSKDLIDSVKLFGTKFCFVIDDYSPELSVNVSSIIKLLQKENISFEIHDYHKNAYFNGWVDYGDLSRKHSYEEAVELYNKCAQHVATNFCWGIDDTGLHPCNISRKCMELGVIPKNGEEYVDILNQAETVDKKRERIRAMYKLEVLTACLYCNGMCDDSQRIQAAEQLTEEELIQIFSK